MLFNDYQKEAMRTAEGMNKSQFPTVNSYTLNGVMGLNGEAGEVIDIVKKHLFQGHKLDKDHLIEELGDCLWYIAVAAKGLNVTLDDVAMWNIKKLKERYPAGFNEDRSINREKYTEWFSPFDKVPRRDFKCNSLSVEVEIELLDGTMVSGFYKHDEYEWRIHKQTKSGSYKYVVTDNIKRWRYKA